MNTRLIFLILEDVFSLVVFFLNRIVTAHGFGPECRAVCGHPVSENGIVHGIDNAE